MSFYTNYVWPAIEGYFFYSALVTVFDTGHVSRVTHYILGYLPPTVSHTHTHSYIHSPATFQVIVALTLTIGLSLGDSPYIKMKDGQVVF